MKFLSKIITAAISGTILGISVLFLSIIAAVGFAYSTSNSVHLPGVIRAWFTVENEMPALNFEPNFFGMSVLIVATSIIFCLATWRKINKTHSSDVKFYE